MDKSVKTRALRSKVPAITHQTDENCASQAQFASNLIRIADVQAVLILDAVCSDLP